MPRIILSVLISLLPEAFDLKAAGYLTVKHVPIKNPSIIFNGGSGAFNISSDTARMKTMSITTENTQNTTYANKRVPTILVGNAMPNGSPIQFRQFGCNELSVFAPYSDGNACKRFIQAFRGKQKITPKETAIAASSLSSFLSSRR